MGFQREEFPLAGVQGAEPPPFPSAPMTERMIDMKKRILIKLSGESLSSGNGCFDEARCREVAHVLAEVARMGVEPGDLVLIVADGNNDIVYDSLGNLRCHCAKKLGLLRPDDYKFLWVTEFPLLEWSEEDGRFYAKHHPFTSPMDEDMEYLDTDPGRVRAKAYDIVLNGTELGGGSIRIHDQGVQTKMFEMLGMSQEEAQTKFGFLLEAFKYGVPPHGGLAFGLDRLVTLMLGLEDIRDVIAFPKVQNASELMSRCPAPADPKALEELGIAVVGKKED